MKAIIILLCNYKSFKVFKPYVKPDIQAYIDLMATESERPSSLNESILIGWDELLNRALARESFLTKYKVSNRTVAVKQALGLATMYAFYGAKYTPLFEYDTMKINSEAKIAYEKVISVKSPAEIKASSLLTNLQNFLKLLDQTGDKKNQAIHNFLQQLSI